MYVIVHRETGRVFPQADKVSTVSPEDFVQLNQEDKVPRLFASRKAANVVLGMWLKGTASKERPASTGWSRSNITKVVSYTPAEERDGEEYEICPVVVTFNGELIREQGPDQEHGEGTA